MVAELFYGRLFRIAPATRALFPETMGEQHRKLIVTLGFIVEHLEDHAALLPAAEALAHRHVEYGVTADQYAPVGEALIWALRQLLGPRFAETDAHAWATAYGVLSGAMIDSAYGSDAAER